MEGLVDRRLARRARRGCRRRSWSACLGSRYRGWNAKHFHEHLKRDHGFTRGFTWTKTQLHAAGLLGRAQSAGCIGASASASRAKA